MPIDERELNAQLSYSMLAIGIVGASALVVIGLLALVAYRFMR